MFTGKPQIGGLGYAFLFRNYRPNLGKWQTQDPLGYPDGWNNMAYCNNKVTDCIDWLGKETVPITVYGTVTNVWYAYVPITDFSYEYQTVGGVVQTVFTVIVTYGFIIETQWPTTCTCENGTSHPTNISPNPSTATEAGAPISATWVYNEEITDFEEITDIQNQMSDWANAEVRNIKTQLENSTPSKIVYIECGE